MTKLKYIFFFCTVILFTAFSCHKDDRAAGENDSDEEITSIADQTGQEMTVKEFLIWCADKNNQLNKFKEISGIRYNLSFLSKEAMAFLELRTQTYDFNQFNETCNHYSDMLYFNFKIEAIEGNGELLKYRLNSPSQYEERVKYMSFDMQQDIYLVQGTDTLSPGLFQFERIFDVAPYATVMFAFDTKKFNKQKEFTIVYNDKLFENSFVKYNYKNKQLINLPSITGL